MRKRNDATVGIQAFYTVAQLMSLAQVPISRATFIKLLREANITFIQNGKALYIPLEELQDKTPVLWSTILAAIKLRSEL